MTVINCCISPFKKVLEEKVVSIRTGFLFEMSRHCGMQQSRPYADHDDYDDGDFVSRHHCRGPNCGRAGIYGMNSPGDIESYGDNEWLDEMRDITPAELGQLQNLCDRGEDDISDVLVLYGSNNCGWSKKAHEEMKALPQYLREENMRVPVGRINCDQHRGFCQQEGVSGYPTIRRYRGGQFYEYNDNDRSTYALLNFLQQQPQRQRQRSQKMRPQQY